MIIYNIYSRNCDDKDLESAGAATADLLFMASLLEEDLVHISALLLVLRPQISQLTLLYHTTYNIILI